MRILFFVLAFLLLVGKSHAQTSETIHRIDTVASAVIDSSVFDIDMRSNPVVGSKSKSFKFIAATLGIDSLNGGIDIAALDSLKFYVQTGSYVYVGPRSDLSTTQSRIRWSDPLVIFNWKSAVQLGISNWIPTKSFNLTYLQSVLLQGSGMESAGLIPAADVIRFVVVKGATPSGQFRNHLMIDFEN